MSTAPAAACGSHPEWLARRLALEAAGAVVHEVQPENGDLLLFARITCPSAECPIRAGTLSISAILSRLCALGVQSVMVEGGAAVIASFLESARAPTKAVDTLIVTIAPTLVGAQGIGYSPKQVRKPPSKMRITERSPAGPKTATSPY
jgi:2,5-diamino-6-(ribosylamino)-4(3H)-pyrimidinone 5'-phosphate reductase